MDYQDEVDLGTDLWASFSYDDSPNAAQALRSLLVDVVRKGYFAVTEKDGHIVHVFNAPELQRMGLSLSVGSVNILPTPPVIRGMMKN